MRHVAKVTAAVATPPQSAATTIHRRGSLPVITSISTNADRVTSTVPSKRSLRCVPRTPQAGSVTERVLRDGILQSQSELIEKPFGPTELLRRVRQVLDGPLVPAGAGAGARPS